MNQVKMENKYYIPDISEFYVGFEYEVLTHENESGIIDWTKFNNPFRIERLYNMIENGTVRVKYLDRKDIEDLGFEFSYFRDSEYVYMHKTKKIMLVNFGPNEYLIAPNKFRGNIKNKSELSKLLKQLRIIDNE